MNTIEVSSVTEQIQFSGANTQPPAPGGNTDQFVLIAKGDPVATIGPENGERSFEGDTVVIEVIVPADGFKWDSSIVSLVGVSTAAEAVPISCF